jgi:excisionase family DNA binding protein
MTNNQNEHSAEMFKEYPDIITILDLQTMLHIGRNAAYKLLQDNSIVSIRVGKKYIIPKASVANFITEGVKK